MASAAITVAENVATIESDTNAAVITLKDGTGLGREGELLNAGATVTAYISISTTTADADVATTNAQAQRIAPLPPGCKVTILPCYKYVTHKCAANSTVLAWLPTKPLRG